MLTDPRDRHDDSAMERYHNVHGRKRVEAIVAAVEASGGRVLSAPSADVAPFELGVQLPDGKALKLVCYAFTANKYGQGGRPEDEHRFQVKYGSDFTRLHDVYVDPKRHVVTLFFGVHEEESLFIAVDPAMHNPTWFSSSVEFKTKDVRTALKRGWHGWDRERVPSGRRRILPQESLATEALLAFTPEHFLTYVQFERVATGMDTGERLLLISNIGDDLQKGGSARSVISTRLDLVAPTSAEHKLLAQFGLPVDQVLDLIAENPRLHTAVRGGVAERHLQLFLEDTPGVSHLQKINKDGEPDFALTFHRSRIRIECKNVSPELTRGLPRVDFQKTRAAKGDPCSRYYSASQFEVLAACIYPTSGEWDFRFCLTSSLKDHKKCVGKLSDRVLVEPSWPADLPTLLTT
jgi:hypothetical protein